MKQSEIRILFNDPPLDYYPRPLWMWNGTPRKEEIREIMEKSRDLSGYGGFHIIPFSQCRLEYMGEEYLDVYGEVLKQAERLGMKLCLYDEWEFPSGSAGGQMKRLFPQYCTKRLDKIEADILGPVLYNQPVNILEADDRPAGKVMGAVAMNRTSLERVDISAGIGGGYLRWEVPEGEWKIMIFLCVTDGWDRVDYLDPEAVDKFIELTHQKYYDRFSSFFPTVIDSAFYDEPNLYQAQGRMWTDKFNERFEEDMGYSPCLLYPALWHDIGPETASARNALLGFRAELYARGFPRQINRWCGDHGITLTGHVDQEEVVNPVGITGDLMKSFKYQDIPGIDEIFFPRRARKVYKIVSSSAYNWGKSLVMSETFGAMGEELTIEQIYRDLFEQFVKGVNMVVPHAIWLDNTPESILFPPELSYRSDKFGPHLKDMNTLIARLSTVLRRGCPVADIAVVYPIHSLQTSYALDSYEAYRGGPVLKTDDYQDVGEFLFSRMNKDFQYLHPEVLDEYCRVEKGVLNFENGEFSGAFSLVLIPGSQTISLSNMRKLKDFYDQGGTVIATGRLPFLSSTRGEDEEVVSLVQALFSLSDPKNQKDNSYCSNAAGGKAYFIAADDWARFSRAVEEVLSLPDMAVLSDDDRKPLCLHKTVEGKNIYYLVNNHDGTLEFDLLLRGTMELENWNPRTGEIRPADQQIGCGARTKVHINLGPVQSVLLCEV